jgi:hypothetical protein
MLAAGIFTATSNAAQRAEAETIITGSLPAPIADAPFELRIEVTKPGT